MSSGGHPSFQLAWGPAKELAQLRQARGRVLVQACPPGAREAQEALVRAVVGAG